MEDGIRMESISKSAVKDVMSVKEAARYLGISESKIRQFIRNKFIPHIKLDGQYKLFLPVLQEWLRQITILPIPAADAEHAQTLTNRIWKATVGE
jgi:excisionase family DNA binding protein